LGVETRRPQVFVCYDLLEGLTNEEEDLICKIELELFSIGTIIISKERISPLSIGVLNIKINEEFDPQQGTSDQGAT
jgi:hypothetical protein